MWACPKGNPLFQKSSTSGKHVAWLDGLRGVAVLSRGEYIFWTIPVEFKFYFVLPVVCFVFMFLVNRNVPAALILVAGFTGLVNLFFWPPETTELNKISLGAYLPIEKPFRTLGLQDYRKRTKNDLVDTVRTFSR